MESLREKVRKAGVVGAGGAGFPAHVKLGARAEVVIANAAECEPLLEKDRQLALQELPLVVAGLCAAATAVGAGRLVFAFKAKYRELATLLAAPENQALLDGIETHLLEDLYPAGDEHVLVHEVTGRVVPDGGIPPDVGVVVHNVETLANIAQAAAGRPVTHKYLTVAGNVAQPATVRVPLGTPAAELLDTFGGIPPGHVLLEGGPVMGRLAGPDSPVSKTTSGFIVLPGEHPLVRGLTNERVALRTADFCTQCRMCTDLCPRFLLGHPLYPHLTMRAMGYPFREPESLAHILICSECGVCDFACPVGLLPRRVHGSLKRTLASRGARYNQRHEPPVPHPERGGRQLPSGRLKARFDLARYDRPAPLRTDDWVPREVHVLLRQHVGRPTEPVVEPGQHVCLGEVVGRMPEGQLGADVHASVNGRVTEIRSDRVVLRTGTPGEGS